MEFKEFKQAIQQRFNEMKGNALFEVRFDKDEIWALYLASFPAGTNPMFRERSQHDCSACRAFVKHAGGMVTIANGELSSIWDVRVEGEYQTVVDALADYVKSKAIENVFLHPEARIGLDKNHEQTESGVRTWEHLYISLPRGPHCRIFEIGQKQAEYEAMHDVIMRALREITVDAVETVQDLIAQNSLYRGAEKKGMVDAFRRMKAEFDQIADERGQDLYAWAQVKGPNARVCKIRNDVIGTLLVNLSEGQPLDTAVKSFEDKVSGTNYQRPTALVTPRMRDAAKQTLTELGLMNALERRYARLEDINISNVLFADRNAKRRMGGDVFDQIPTKAPSVKNLDRVEEVTIADFLANILPTAKSLEVLFENRHAGNLVSLIAPADLTAKGMFKWENAFSWSYHGDVADSIKERVKAAGGNVTGDVCCRLAWFNTDDLDFHMREPNGHEIFYQNKGHRSLCGGKLDVDANGLDGIRPDPCENIFYERLDSMPPGTYQLDVNQYCQRQTQDGGFEVEIDIKGTIHHFTHPNALRSRQRVTIANLKVTERGVEVLPVLASTPAQREVWGMKTQDFLPVTALMLSPNFWDERGIGNKHFFFMLDGCRNDGSARGFYNEFLSSELEPHRKTMEIVGSRMRTEECEDQLSGLGFSSTQRNHLICRVHGSFTRLVKIAF